MKLTLKDKTRVTILSFKYRKLKIPFLRPIPILTYDEKFIVFYNDDKDVLLNSMREELVEALGNLDGLVTYCSDYTVNYITLKKDLSLPNGKVTKIKCNLEFFENPDIFANFITSLLTSKASIKIQKKHKLTIAKMRDILEEEFKDYKKFFSKVQEVG